ncbi:MAG: maleate cis-trans isomerase family protein, partial [Sciscionella sp.]
MSVRIGMLTPSSNTCLEPVTYRILACAEGVTAHFSRLTVTRISLQGTSSAQFDAAPMVTAARLLADAKVDVVVWNGTSGSWLGIEHDREVVRALERETGVAATTSTLALLDACTAFGVHRLGLAVPYTEEVMRRIVDTYAGQGVSVVSERGLDLTDNLSFARTPPGLVRELITDAAVSDAQAVAVVCTNMHGAPHVAALEAELGIPVLDSVSATLWKALDV